MSHVFVQSTGEWLQDDVLLGTGWAGKYTGKNNPAMQNVKDTGPLPCGWYTIKESYTHPHLGPITMDLEPDPSNEMYGRDLFRCHGINAEHPETSSDGCVCEPHDTRVLISKAQQLGDDRLQVVATPQDR